SGVKLGTAPHTSPIPHRDVAPAAASSRPGPRPGGGSPAAIVVAALAVLGLLGLTARATTLRRAPGDEAWVLELERALARSGRPPAAGLTLVALERRLASAPEAAAYVRAIRVARFGGGSLAPSPAGRRALRSQLGSGLGVLGRMRALWALPPVRIRTGPVSERLREE
ncbi:MAG TPA: hypothetical protein VIM18_05495, partial [Solirubrobacteraceae bacterium]